MLRMINFLLIGLMLAGAGIVYDLKYEAERASARVARIAHKIDGERDAIATLKAEWSLLNQPKRLQELTERHRAYLELDPLDPTQIGSIDDVPFKPAVPAVGLPAATAAGSPPAVPLAPKPASKGSVRLAGPEKGPETTGSIGKFLDRLPSGGHGAGPTIPKASGAPLTLAPMGLVPKAPAVPVARPTDSQAKVIR